MIARAAPPVPGRAYATYGTKELDPARGPHWRGLPTCPSSHDSHGSRSEAAMSLTIELETLAQQYYLSLAIGGAKVLPDSGSPM